MPKGRRKQNFRRPEKLGSLLENLKILGFDYRKVESFGVLGNNGPILELNQVNRKISPTGGKQPSPLEMIHYGLKPLVNVAPGL